MKISKFTILLSLLTIGLSSAASIGSATRISQTVENSNWGQQVRKAFDNSSEEDDAQLLFIEACAEVFTELPNYIDLTALNVTDKEAIDLDNYDSSYELPLIEDLTTDIYIENIADLDYQELTTLEVRRQESRDFDYYFGLALNRLNHNLGGAKYSHPNYAFDPSSAVNQLSSVLALARMASAAITAIKASLTSLIAALKVAWLPLLCAALVAAALTVLAIIIIANWDIISTVFSEITTIFLSALGSIANQVQNFFDLVFQQGLATTISSTMVIGGQTFVFHEVKANNVAKSIAITEANRRKNDVYLMRFVSTNSFQISPTPVSEQFCIQFKTHAEGLSSYTWYQNVARRLIINAGSGYTTLTPELHLFNETKGPLLAWKHFHNCTASGIRIESEPMVWTHSFFGLLYYSPNSDGIGIPHPDNPLP